MSNPYKIIEPTCISFSGGRTSAYMLYKVLEAHDMNLPDDAIICFQNTGKEDEATLRFVHECETRWNVKIHWIEYRNNDQGYTVVNYETASREGEPFEELIRKNNYLPRTHQNDPYGVIALHPCIALENRLNPSQGDILRSRELGRHQ